MNIKYENAAGTFYPETKDELNSFLNTLLENNKPDSGFKTRAIIAPHAGYIFSGGLAAKCYQYLDTAVKNVFIFAPSHYARIFGCVSSDYDEFQTPLGNLLVNKEVLKELAIDINNQAFEREHSIEVHLPFIKKLLPEVKIIPILYGCEDYLNITKIIEKYWGNKENAFVISSDLSHFYPAREAVKIDTYTANLIENNETRNFEAEMACGAVGICGIVNFAKERGFSLIRAGLTNSSASTGDTSRVVGYGGWFLYEGIRGEYIKEYLGGFVKELCRKSIESGLQLGNSLPEKYPEVLCENGASFVTLEIQGQLRGCIGSIIAHRTLFTDLVKNAHAAAFSDPRFMSLTIDEFKHTDISVSLLSKPEKIDFKDENDLLDKMVPLKDGIIIKDGSYQAVYLPEVWEQLPDKKLFLASLKQKAGLSKNHFSETFEAFRFYTTKI